MILKEHSMVKPSNIILITSLPLGVPKYDVESTDKQRHRIYTKTKLNTVDMYNPFNDNISTLCQARIPRYSENI